MIRLVIGVFAWSGVLMALMAGSARAVSAERPNVLFLFTDDQRADAIAALGHPVIQTPHLDELVERGFTFNNAYCMGSTIPAVCNPSRHMVLSGRSLFRYDQEQVEGTFGDVMQKAGYETWALSKRGNIAKRYHTAFEHSDFLDETKERSSGHHGRTGADRVIDFVNNGWDRTRPFFIYMAFEGPHDPRVAAEEWMKLYERRALPLPADYLPHHPFDQGELIIRDERLAPWPRTPEVVREHLHDYYACISSIDHNIGRIMAALRDGGVLENTIVVFSSDHGLAVGSHGLFGKQSVYECAMKAPLIFAGPGIPHGQSDALVYLYDIYPTVADLTGADTPDDLDGRSLAPIMRGEAESVREVMFLAYKGVQRAVRQGDWKLIRFPRVNITQLFNLRDDPHEQVNLSGMAEHRPRVEQMLALLAEQQKVYDDTAPLTIDEPKPALVDAPTIRERAGAPK